MLEKLFARFSDTSLGHGVPPPQPTQCVQAPGAALSAPSCTGQGGQVGVSSTQVGSGVGLSWAQLGLAPGGAFRLQSGLRGRQSGVQGRAWLQHEGAG